MSISGHVPIIYFFSLLPERNPHLMNGPVVQLYPEQECPGAEAVAANVVDVLVRSKVIMERSVAARAAGCTDVDRSKDVAGDLEHPKRCRGVCYEGAVFTDELELYRHPPARLEDRASVVHNRLEETDKLIRRPRCHAESVFHSAYRQHSVHGGQREP